MSTERKQSGFTLIELMITIAIVGILAAVAIPSYISYTNKARFTEVIQKVAADTAAVAVCAQRNNSLVSCDGGKNGIPADISEPVGNVASVTISNGVITGTGVNPADTYVQTPAMQADGTITWTTSGTCTTNGTC